MKHVYALLLILALVLSFGCTDHNATSPVPGIYANTDMPTLQKRHYSQTGIVVAPPATAVLHFAMDPLPALQCTFTIDGITWNAGYSEIPGVLDGFVTEVVNGRTLLKFNATIYNSSLTDTFKITDRSGVDASGDVTDFWQAELLDANGTHLQYAGGKEFMRFVCYETRPIQCGYLPTQEYLMIAPQWADTYPASMNDQWFDMTDLPTGAYSIRFNVDPLLKYGQTQVGNVNGTWDGLIFNGRGGVK